MDMAGLIDRLAAYLALVIGHFKTQVALATAVGVAFSVFVNHSHRVTANPNMEAENFYSFHFLS